MAEKDLGKNIAYYRKEKGLLQEKVAEYMEVSRQAVTKWESGLSRPSTENLIRLSELLGVSVQILLGSNKQSEKAERPAINVSKAPFIFIAISVLTIIIYIVAGIRSSMLSAGILICLFVMAVPVQLFLHLYFANAVKNNSFTGIAGYNAKLEYDMYELKKLLSDIDLRLSMVTTVYIVIMCVVSLADIGIDWLGAVLLFSYIIEFVATIIISNYNAIDRIYVNAVDKRRARLGLPLAVIYCMVIVIAVAVMIVLFEVRGIENNTAPAIKLCAWLIVAIGAATVGMIAESGRINKLGCEKKYRPGRVSLVCLGIAVVAVAWMVA